MGCCQICAIFENFSTALEWIATNKLNCQGVVHILDDFLFIERDRYACTRTLLRFLAFCKEVGIRLLKKQLFLPNTVMEFIGMTLDSLKMPSRK